MWKNLQFPANLVTFTKEIPNGTLHFFFAVDVAICKFDWKPVTILEKALS